MNRFKMRVRPLSAAVAMAVALSLSGCGGGGGSNIRPAPSAAPPPAPAPSPSPAPGPPPPLDAQLALTNTYAAHDAGYTGKGVIIGVVDTGINNQHPALKGQVVDSKIYLDCAINDCNTDDVVGHGTWVSQIAAGQEYAQFPGGIAPGAQLVSARIIQDKEPKDDGTGNGGNKVEASDADFFANYLNPYLVQAGVQVMNNSWGGLYWDPANADAVGKAFAAAFRPFIINHGGIVVFATGNNGAGDHGSPQPSDTAAIPNWGSDLERGWIAAAALDSNNPTQLAKYSNACGKAMNYCISAPGDVVVLDKDTTASTPQDKLQYLIVEGTSFAAPEVSGAAAVVWQAFPYFNNDMVRQTILGTAKDLGAKGVDPVFGWGGLDVGKAVKGPANFAWGDVSVTFDGITSTWSNDIVGGGGLSKDGTGTLVLAGNDSYQGDTKILGGTLQSAHVLPGNVNVSAGAALGGMYASGDTPVGVPGAKGNLVNAGTVLVAGGDAEIGGNYAQASSGVLSVSLGSKLDVTGTATLNGTLNIAGKDAGYTTSSHENLLSAAGGVSGTFASLTKASGVFLSSTLQYDANDVWIDTSSLSITTTAASHGMGAQPAVMGSAQRLDAAFGQIDAQLASGGSQAVSSSFVGGAGAIQHTQTMSAAQTSLQSLSGELHAASAAMAFETIDASSRAVSDRFDGLMDRGGYGMWTQQLNLGGSMARSGFDGVNFQLNGWMVGSDRRVGVHGVAGFAFSQSRGDQRLDARMDRDRSRNSQAMMYAGWMRGNWYTQGRVGLGHFQQDVSRQLLLGAQWQPVSTHYNGQYKVAYGESGLNLRYGANKITPYVSVQYAQLDRDGFSEQGAYGFGLQAAAQTLDRWQAGAGVRAARHLDFSGGRSLDFTARVQFQRTLATNGAVFDASFVGVKDWQPLVGIGLSRYSGLAGVGLNAHLSRNTTLKFNYDYQKGQRVTSKQVMARFNLAF
jgi:autotransporter-associated beta strand protein